VLQEVDIILTDTVPRFIIKDAIGSDAGAAWRFNWNTSIKACVGSLFYIWPVTEPLVVEKVVNDMNFAGVLVVAVGSFVSLRYIDGMLAD
jgi:hypothetical protein